MQGLSELFSLTPFERDVLLIGLAPELEERFVKLYAYLKNDLKKTIVDGILLIFGFSDITICGFPRNRNSGMLQSLHRAHFRSPVRRVKP
nr:hypothetical protein [Methanosarcina sp. UBA5]